MVILNGADRILSKGLAVGVILLFIGLAIQPSVAVQPEQEIDIEKQINGGEKDQYPVFGFLPMDGRGVVYQYWVIPGIQGFVYIHSFEGDCGIFTINGISTEPPTYFSRFLPEFIITKILMKLNLI